MTEIPDFMPRVRRGSHVAGGAFGACIMEYASFIAGEEWSDSPQCVDRTLAKAARDVNDAMTDDLGRARLLELLPRLMATGGQYHPHFPDRCQFQLAALARFRKMIEEGILRPAPNARLREGWGASILVDHVASDDDRYLILEAMLDEHERVFGRREPAGVDPAQVAELSSRMVLA